MDTQIKKENLIIKIDGKIIKATNKKAIVSIVSKAIGRYVSVDYINVHRKVDLKTNNANYSWSGVQCSYTIKAELLSNDSIAQHCSIYNAAKKIIDAIDGDVNLLKDDDIYDMDVQFSDVADYKSEYPYEKEEERRSDRNLKYKERFPKEYEEGLKLKKILGNETLTGAEFGEIIHKLKRHTIWLNDDQMLDTYKSYSQTYGDPVKWQENLFSFSCKLKEMKAAAGFTQQDVANLLSRPKRTIANWESGINVPDKVIQEHTLRKLYKESKLFKLINEK